MKKSKYKNLNLFLYSLLILSSSTYGLTENLVEIKGEEKVDAPFFGFSKKKHTLTV